MSTGPVGGRVELGRMANVDLWNDSPWPCSVSEFLLGEVDSSTLLAVPPGDPSQVRVFVGGSGHLPQGGHLVPAV